MLLLASCGSTVTPASAPPASSAPTASKAAPAATSPSASAAPAAKKPATASQAGLTTVKVAWNTITANQSPAWVAQDEGLFRKHGLDVSLSFIEGSVAALPALTTGEVSILETTPVAAVQANLKGLDTVVLGDHIPFINQRLVGVAGIKTIQDLKGKTIGATKAGSSDDFTLHLVLKKQGMDPTRDVKISYLGSVPAQVAALSKNLVQAIVVSPPNNLTAEKVGGHEVLNFYDLHIPYPGDGVTSTRAFVAQHNDVVVKFLEGYVEAIASIKSNPTQAKQVIAKYTKQNDPQALDATYQALVQVLPDKPVPDPAGIQTILDSIGGGQGKNPADFMDPKPMAEALKALGK
ncbi:MAG TPA: ABC transporter substrate-binding protein [Chloroflexota bacterium]|nr:ABC transporter substrate-binding protein [Chloroflexota bacterium]